MEVGPGSVCALTNMILTEHTLHADIFDPDARRPFASIKSRSPTSSPLHELAWRVQLEVFGSTCVPSCIPMPKWGQCQLWRAFSNLPDTLRNRTILFVGDDEELVFADLVWAIEFYSSGELAPPTRIMSKNSGGSFCSTWPSFDFSVCIQRATKMSNLMVTPTHAPRSNARATCNIASSWRGSKLAERDFSQILPCLHKLLPDEVGKGRESLRTGDIVVGNSGKHHIQPNLTLAPTVQAFVDWNKQQAKHSTAPIVLWKETSPHHFGTSPSGEVDALQSPGVTCVETSGQCAPFSPEHSQGSQMYNAISTPIILDAGIPLISTFKAGAPLWELHTDCAGGNGAVVDCATYPLPSPFIRMSVLSTLVAIEKEILKREFGS
jgi:hypothetical protein